jgi:predicted permease
MNDLRSAVRALRGDPWFTLVLVVPLALGIGVNAALIGIVDSLLLRPLPGITASRLTWVSAIEHGTTRPSGLAYPEIEELRGAGVFDSVAAFRQMSFNLGGGTEPERVHGEAVTGNYFDTLGVRAAAGRWFRPEEDRAGAAAVAVIGHDLWQRRYEGRPSAVGQPLVVNGLDCTIVGVAPRGFIGATLADSPPQIWVPASLLASVPAEVAVLGSRDHGTFETIARLKADGPAPVAAAVLRRIAANLDPVGGRRLAGFSLTPLRGSSHPSDRRDVASLAAVAFTISAVVLLIACANVSALLLGRSTVRTREIGIRLALGAGRGRIVRQLVTESLLVSLAAGLVALVLAWWTTRALVAALGVPFPMGTTPDLATLMGTLAVSGAAAVLFGLAPALHASRGSLVAALGPAGTAGATRGRARLQRASAVFQVALSLALLAAAGGLVRTARAGLVAADADPDAARILAASIDLADQGYPAARQCSFASELAGAVQSLPGVEACSLAMIAPGRGAMYGTIETGAAGDPGRPLLARSDWVWSDYFRTMGMAVVRGRDFSPADTAGSPQVAVVNEALARMLWPGQEPIGQLLRFGPSDAAPQTVVGVVRDRSRRAGEKREPAVFLPRGQIADDRQPWVLLVRTSGPAAALAPSLRQAVRRIDPSLPLFDVATLREIEGERLRPRQAAAGAVNVLGAVALLLAALGVYGLVSWRAARRHREIGVRMALGATRGDVLRMVASDGLRIGATGSAVGLGLGAVAARLVSALTGGSAVPDVTMLLAVTTVVWLAVSVASCVPARRATRVNPADALRAE